MVGEASGRMQKADCRDEIALPAAMLAWLKCGKQRTRNSRKRFLVFFCSLFVKARVVYRLPLFCLKYYIFFETKNQDKVLDNFCQNRFSTLFVSNIV